MKTLIAPLAALALAGCATTHDVEMAKAHYAAQASKPTTPIFEMTAQPGQQITGLQSLRVYAPGGQPTQQYRTQHHPAWGLVGDTMRIAAPIWLGGRAAADLADVVGRRVGDAATQPITGSYNTDIVRDSGNVTTWENSGRMDSPDTWTNSGRIDSPDTYDSTHAPTVVVPGVE